ncbi:unnamed protein product, partial [Prorocentrum cordatum]
MEAAEEALCAVIGDGEAQGVDIVAAGAAELRCAQRGPRLEGRAAPRREAEEAAVGAMRAEAPSLFPAGLLGAVTPDLAPEGVGRDGGVRALRARRHRAAVAVSFRDYVDAIAEDGSEQLEPLDGWPRVRLPRGL